MPPPPVEVRAEEDAGKTPPPTAAAPPAAAAHPVSMLALLRFATGWDVFMMFLGALGGAANGASMAAFTILLGNIFDSLNSPKPEEAQRISLIFVWVGLGLMAASVLQVGCFTYSSERMTVKLRKRYLKAVLEQEVAFFDEAGSSTLGSKVAEASLAFREGLGEKLGAMFQFSALFFGGIIVGFTYTWQLSLVILSVVPFLGVAGYFMASAIGQLMSGSLDSYAKAGGVAEESFALIRTVSSLGIQHERIKKYDDALAEATEKSKEMGKSMGLGFGATMFIYFGSYGLAFWVASLLISNSRTDQEVIYPLGSNPLAMPFCVVGGVIPQMCTSQILPANSTLTFQTAADVCACPFCFCGCWPNGAFAADGSLNKSTCLTGGDVILTFFSVVIGAFGIGQAAPSITAINKARVAASQLYEVIDRLPRIANDPDAKPLPGPVKGSFTFENVSFHYPSRPDAPIFNGLSLDIPAGKRVAFCGQSGSGKSTALMLLQRFYDPTAGRVLLDGTDLRKIQLADLRSHMGLVSQEPTLFATSILQNIAFGSVQPKTQAEIEKACKDANAHDFIMGFPNGYNTFVGGAGAQLSGGQKQRIAIARALLRDPRILLLDEATAALDNESERLVNEAIDKVMDSGVARTIIMIAHRMTSIRNADKIIVFDKGKVLEQGTHEVLMAVPDGMYASLVKISEGAGARHHGSPKKVTSPKSPATLKAAAAAGPEQQQEDVPTGVLAATVQDNSEEDEEGSGTTTNAASNGATTVVVKAKKYPISKAFVYAKPDKLWFIPGVISSLLNGLTFPVFSLLLSELMATFYLANSSAIRSEASIWALAFLGLAIANGLAIFGMNYSFGIINGRMTARVRSALFTALVRREVAFFDRKENSVGALTSKLASDAAMVKASISDRLEVGLQNIATAVAGFTIAFVASWKVSLVVFAMFPALAISGAAQMMVLQGLANSDSKQLAEAAQTLSESISGIRTVQSFGMKPVIVDLYDQQLAKPLAGAKRKGFVGGFAFGLSQAVMFFAYALTFWYGSGLIRDGEITFKDLNQSLFGILMTAMALGQTSAMAPDLAKGASAVQSVFSVLDEKSEIDPLAPEGEQPSVMKGDISFQGVSFAYPTRKQVNVFEGFSTHFERGKTIALVGTSGSGKSSIVQLTQRFYDPDAGSVQIDGVDVKTLNVKWLRDHIGIVSQEPVLFDDTILTNIRYGNLNATDEECMRAAEQAAAKDFIDKLPDGFNTRVGLRGGALSGGQRQRVAIARALVRGEAMRILLLDEATSALDETSQRSVQQTLDKLLEHSTRTTLIVAHRLSTVRNADVIVVLERGKIVESGTFEQLKAAGGAFARLLQAQEKQGE